MDESRPNYYAVIPANVRYDDRLETSARLLYGEIAALLNDDGYCFFGNAFITKSYGWSDRTISRLLKSLEDNGHIRRVIIKDKSGQVVQRRIYLRVSLPDVQPPDEIVTTPCQNCREGGDKNGGYTNTSITVNKKENKKEKAEGANNKRTPLTDEQLRDIFIEWIGGVATEYWSKNDKNMLYFALDGFYSPRANKKQEPARTAAAFTALSNRLVRYSDGNPTVMIDMLERATTAGWKSVFPLGGDRAAAVSERPTDGRAEEWL